MDVQKFRNFVITEFVKSGIHCIYTSIGLRSACIWNMDMLFDRCGCRNLDTVWINTWAWLPSVCALPAGVTKPPQSQKD